MKILTLLIILSSQIFAMDWREARRGGNIEDRRPVSKWLANHGCSKCVVVYGFIVNPADKITPEIILTRIGASKDGDILMLHAKGVIQEDEKIAKHVCSSYFPMYSSGWIQEKTSMNSDEVTIFGCAKKSAKLDIVKAKILNRKIEIKDVDYK